MQLREVVWGPTRQRALWLAETLGWSQLPTEALRCDDFAGGAYLWLAERYGPERVACVRILATGFEGSIGELVARCAGLRVADRNPQR